MKLFTNATLKIVEAESFAGENGETVQFFKNYLKNPEGEMLVANSKRDFSSVEGEKGVATLLVREREKGGFKVSLDEFAVGDFAEEPEKTVA